MFVIGQNTHGLINRSTNQFIKGKADMQTINCPACGEPLPGSARFCARCGADSPASEPTFSVKRKRSEQLALARQVSLENKKMPYEPVETTSTIKLFRRGARAGMAEEFQAPFYEVVEEDLDDEVIERHETWQKVIEHKTPPTIPIVALPHTRAGTFYSLLPRFPRRKLPPRLFFWLILGVLLMLLLGGTFGVALSFGREEQKSNVNQSALQASPANIALGGIVTLRGMHFTPSGQIELSRDQELPLFDTGGVQSIQANASGSFSDTFIVGPSWLAGIHALYATNLRTRQRIAAEITVTGQSLLQGPPHLLLSANTLGLGAGDETTNGSELLGLSNAGGGQLSWQARVSQPWLQISPKSGSITRGETMSAIVAVDRANLAPGPYPADIVFTSNTEQVILNVTMQVIPLQLAHQAVLQLSPATLTFTGTAGGPDPQSQVIIVSNPGVSILTWGATISLQNGFGWLSVLQTTGNVQPNDLQVLIVSVNIRNLSPGVYKGAILFSNYGQEAIQGSPQSIYISLTVTPMCTLALAPGNLSFTGTAGQANPAAQSLRVTVAQGCTTSQHWSATIKTTTGGAWLKTNLTSGSTPSQVQVSINTSGIAQGTYSGTITFTTSTGPQVVPVTLNINPVPCAITGPGTLALQGTAGQSGAVVQSLTLSTTGSCPNMLNWTVVSTVVTPSGGTWLSVTPSGTLTQPATSSVSVQASLTGLSASTATGTVTITAVDSVNSQPVGSVQVAITLTVLAPPPPCTLLAISASTLTFSASVGSDPATPTQNFTISVNGTCVGNVTITPSGDAGSSSWLSIAPIPASVSSGGQATFTVTVASSALASGSYTGTITLNAADGNGAITGSPQSVIVSLTVQ
jgi:hypothetical protein